MQQESRINFNDEIKEFIDQGFIIEYKKLQDDFNGFVCQFKTLEGYNFVVECSVQDAIQIKKSDHPDIQDKQFECWEQLLNLYSLMYVQRFNKLLNEKLENLE